MSLFLPGIAENRQSVFLGSWSLAKQFYRSLHQIGPPEVSYLNNRLNSASTGGTSARATANTSNIPPRRIHSTPIQSVSPILWSSSGGILLIAYLTPKKQVPMEATKNNSDAPKNIRDDFLMP